MEDGIPYAIDFMNPAPDAGLESVGAENFRGLWTRWRRWRLHARGKPAMRRCRTTLVEVSVAQRIEEYHERHDTRPSLNIGIEEEYQTIDPDTRDLRSHIHAEIVQKGKTLLAERVKPEMHQSVVEIGTGVCSNIKEAKRRDPLHPPADHRAGARRTVCGSPPAARIPLRSGASRRFIPTTATAPSSKT